MLVLSLITLTNTNAQITEQLFLPRATELLNLSTEELRFIDQVRDRTFVADVQLVSLANVFDLQDNGYVRFTFLDSTPRNIIVETLDIQYEAADNYRYKGIVRDREGLSIGELIINRLPQGYSGDFRYHDQAYEILPLNQESNILARKSVP